MISNRIFLKKSQIKDVLKDINKSTKIIFLNRKTELDKDPYSFFLEVGIDLNDAIEIIKTLEVEDYQYSQYDVINKFGLMHIFFKEVCDKSAYIKIGFKIDKTVVISFHEKVYEN